MEAKGIIFTALDTDHDNIESWNRWYDLEHLPPNIAMPEIAAGCRYVAPPELHDIRLPTTGTYPGFDDGKGVNVTIYLTSVDPGDAIQAMTEFREVLEAGGRMEGAGRRTVRTGDAMDLSWVVGDPALRLDDRDVPHVGHTGIRVVLRRGDGDARAAAERAALGRHCAPSAFVVHFVLGVAVGDARQRQRDAALALAEGRVSTGPPRQTPGHSFCRTSWPGQAPAQRS